MTKNIKIKKNFENIYIQSSKKETNRTKNPLQEIYITLFYLQNEMSHNKIHQVVFEEIHFKVENGFLPHFSVRSP